MYKFLLALVLSTITISSAKSQVDLKEYFTFYITPDTAIVQTPSTWTVVIKAKKEIPQNAKFKVKFIKGFGNLQNLIAIGANYVTANVNTQGANVQINQIVNSSTDYQPFWEDNVMDRIITLTVRNRPIPVGDSIRIFIGNNNILSGRANPPLSAFTDKIEIAAALDGGNQFTLSDEQAIFRIFPMQAFTLNLIAQTVFHTNKTGKILISASDVFHNLADRFVGTIHLNGPSSDDATYPRTVEITAQDSGKIEIPITFKKEGNYYFTATTNVPNVSIPRSNPIKVLNDYPFVYWGDLHSHGSPSRDAFGTGRYYYARYARGLDFFCATDHVDHNVTINGISDRDWAFQKEEVIQSYEPGKFVSFIGYENSFLYPSGHYNIIFNSKNEDIPNIPIWPLKTFENIQNIWRVADTSNFDIITIPHHCGKVFYTANEGNRCLNCNTFGGIYNNPKYKMLIEIFSNHGLSESYAPNHNLNYTNKASNGKPFNGPHYAQDGWALGEKLGVISSSDDHFSHPGLPHNGIAAVMSYELDRDPIFKSLKQRATYGTTGDRIFIDFRINDEMMGREIVISKEDSVKIFVEVLGTDQIDYVEILKWDFIHGSYTSGHPQYQILAKLQPLSSNPSEVQAYFIDNSPADSAMYYLRVKQKNFRPANNKQYEIWGWSSPIWVTKKSTIEESDSLLYYKVHQELRNINHSWAYHHQHQNNSYEVQQLNLGQWETIYTILSSDSNTYHFSELAKSSGEYTFRLVTNQHNGFKVFSEPKTIHVEIDSMIELKSKHDGNTITLDWETHLETHTQFYEIQLFDPEKNEFITVQSIDAVKNIQTISELYTYQYTVLQPRIYQFRIVQHFNDGSSQYDYWKTIEIIQTSTKNDEVDNAIQIFKNPVQQGESLLIQSSINLQGQYWISDISGKMVVSRKNIYLQPSVQSISVPHLPSGIYHIHLKNHTQLFTIPFIIIP